MTTHKIGNQVTCVIRAYDSTPIGDYKVSYNNEPYTIIKGENASATFTSESVDMMGRDRNGAYATEKIDSIILYNVTLTDKILNLIYLKNKEVSITFTEELLSSEDKKLFLSKGLGKQKKLVFIFDADDSSKAPILEKAIETLEADEDVVEVDKANAYYFVVYEVITNKAYSLDARKSMYVALDLMTISNTDDKTSNTWLHIDKAIVKVNKNMYFNTKANAVDLTFSVVRDSKTENYLVSEE